MVDESRQIPRSSVSLSFRAARVFKRTHAIRFESLVEAPKNPANAATYWCCGSGIQWTWGDFFVGGSHG